VATGMAALPPSPDAVSVASSADARGVPPSEPLRAFIPRWVHRTFMLCARLKCCNRKASDVKNALDTAVYL